MEKVKLYIVIVSLILLNSFKVMGQDVAVTSSLSPNSWCDLTNSETVGVVILNNSPQFIPANTVTVSYTINGGGLVQQLLATNLGPGATWNFTFSTNANLSACQEHNIQVWVDLAGDTNPNNDSLAWVVQNDCTISPGEVIDAMTVCEISNTGTLELQNSLNGTISDWVFSIDGGGSWTSLNENDTTYTFNDLTETTLFAVAFDGGLCPNDTSSFVQINVQEAPDSGPLEGADSLCISAASGTLELNNSNRPILDWESSQDDGISWTSSTNTNTEESYTNLTTTTWYRVLIDGGVCPDVYSDTAIIYIEEETIPGNIVENTIICSDDTLTLTLTNFLGDVLQWEYSFDNNTWFNINQQSPVLNIGGLTNDKYFRALVQNGVCFSIYSDTVFVEVDNPPSPGNITGAISTCQQDASGTLELQGTSSSVIEWQFSIDEGDSWQGIANTTYIENFNNLTLTTWYRVFLDGETCSDIYSDTAIISVDQLTDPGILLSDTAVCFGDSVIFNLTDNVGTVLNWESSFNGNDWTSLNIQDSTYEAISVENNKLFRVLVQNGICPEEYSNTVFLTVNALPFVDLGNDLTITEGDTVQLQASTNGVLGMWFPGQYLSDSTIIDPLAFPMSTTTFTYTTISSEGCLNSDEITLFVNPPISLFDIKNTITANNDGFNDFWIIEGIEAYPNTKVSVYNIYGVEVFQDDDYQNDWRGTYKGKNLPNGTYLYIVEPSGEEVIKGTLTILGNE